MRKSLMVAVTTVTFLLTLVAPASAASLIGNEGNGLCLSTAGNYAGAPVTVGTCNASEAYWSRSPAGLLGHQLSGLCLEVPSTGGYAYLQRCDGTFQYFQFVRSTGLIGVQADTSRMLEVDPGTNRVRSAHYSGSPYQHWRW
jgi:hypothetical protein